MCSPASTRRTAISRPRRPSTSIPCRGSIEDHASNLPLAVTKCRQMVDNLRYLVGMEALFALSGRRSA